MTKPQVAVVTGDFEERERERMLAALKASRCGTWRWNIAEDRVEWDEALCDVYGLPPERAPRTSGEFLSLIHPDDREHAWSKIRACIEEGTDADYQFRAVVNGEMRWIYDRSALVRTPDGAPAYMLGACLDVTERRRAQEERDAALEKQRLLLRELGHRVKNHLGMIASLLRLKQSRQTDTRAAEDFARAIERVNTIAYLHDRLYRSGELQSVDVEEYLADICDNLQASLLADTRIRIVRDIEAFRLHVDKAVPIGLIVNEVITNAFKYAFRPGEEGRITVRLRVRGDRATLTISDNGRGFGAGQAQGVGTRLVRGLAAQIGARLRVVSRRGVTYSLTFSARPVDSSPG
ncbi:MAG TPA: histidine kinase dimerization/phosphoacceptor domain -containing protein [Bauldia sp.]|nr:histidine kinase dimerization/phosphoacceptor domain -containing protein [Bauldia sp.]